MAHRTVFTVRKHIVPQEALAGTGVAVSVEESAEGGVVVAGLEVVEARLRIVVVPAIAQRVAVGQPKCCVRRYIAPGIVGVFCDFYTFRSDKCHYVALQIQHIVVPRAVAIGDVVKHVGPTALVIKKVVNVAVTVQCKALTKKLTGGVNVIMPNAVHDLIGPQTIYIVVIADTVSSVACRCQLPPVPPGHGPGGKVAYIEEAGGVACAVVGIAAREARPVFRAADGGQQIQPIGVPVGIADAVAAVILAAEIAVGVVPIVPGAVYGADGPGKLELVVIGIGQAFGCAAVRIQPVLREDIPHRVIGIAQMQRGEHAAARMDRGRRQLGDVARCAAPVKCPGVCVMGRCGRRRHGADPAQIVIAERDIGGLIRGEGNPLLRQAAVIGVVFVTFLIGFSGERPDLLAQPVAVVILMLRLQSDGAAGLHGAPDQSAQGVVGIAIDNPPGHVLFLRKMVLCVLKPVVSIQ